MLTNAKLQKDPSTRTTKLPNPNTEDVVLRPPDIPERVPIRSRTSSGQNILSTERLPARNTSATSSVRLPSSTVDKLSSTKLTTQSDFEVDRSPILNHSIQMDKTQIAKTRQRNLPSKRSSNPLLDEANSHQPPPPQQHENLEVKTSNIKIPTQEEATSMYKRRYLYHNEQYSFVFPYSEHSPKSSKTTTNDQVRL